MWGISTTGGMIINHTALSKNSLHVVGFMFEHVLLYALVRVRGNNTKVVFNVYGLLFFSLTQVHLFIFVNLLF